MTGNPPLGGEFGVLWGIQDSRERSARRDNRYLLINIL